MPTLPSLPDASSLLVRTDFTDDAAWAELGAEATREYGPDGFRAYVEPVSDPRWSGASWGAVKAAAPAGETGPSVLFIADSITFASPEHPVLVVDLQDEAEFPEAANRMPFRCLPSALWSVENNLNLANLDWEDYAGLAGEDGVFRGFDLPPVPEEVSVSEEEVAEAERQARLAEQMRHEMARELSDWGGGNAWDMATLDVDLAEAIAATSPGTQRSIARWAARRACEVAGMADLDWVAPALRALEQGKALPPPFDDEQQVWRTLLTDPRVSGATVVSIDEGVAGVLRAAMALPALFDAAAPDPLDAALQALYAAAQAFGRDDYPALLAQVRSTYRL